MTEFLARCSAAYG